MHRILVNGISSNDNTSLQVAVSLHLKHDLHSLVLIYKHCSLEMLTLLKCVNLVNTKETSYHSNCGSFEDTCTESPCEVQMVA